MQKDDLIYDMVKKNSESLTRIEEKLTEHVTNQEVHGKGLTVKEFGILAGIVTTVCTTAVTIATIVVNGGV